MRTVVGAYAAAPRFEGDADFRRYVDQVLALPRVDGLEIPYFLHDESPWRTFPYLRASPAESRHVLTLLPTMVAGMGAAPGFGLASIDDDGRGAALDAVRRARRFVADANDAGGGSIASVELHSAPLRSAGSREAFARSLREIEAWDWADVRVDVEHCDALTDLPPAKGFLDLDDELEAIRSTRAGMVINWARSAIETRSVAGPRDHIALCGSPDALTGVVFSGCADIDTAYGAGWEAPPLPMSGWATDELAATSSASLLTRGELEHCVSLALSSSRLDFLGVKVCAPPAATVHERLSLLAGNVSMLALSIDSVSRPAALDDLSRDASPSQGGQPDR